MKIINSKICILLATCFMCVLLFGACSSVSQDQTSESNNNNPNGAVTFDTEDINGNSYTQDIFSDYELTMINVFTTWCTPCVNEMPDLEKLRHQMADRNVNVVGIVLDAVDENGEIIESELEKAQLLAEETGVTYTILVPDSTLLNVWLSDIESVPQTFFVDKDGNVVGDCYIGSNDLEGWTDIVEKELGYLK